MFRLGLVGTGMLLSIGAFNSLAQADTLPRFEQTTCSLPDTTDMTPRLRCGVVRVPRDYQHPDGRTFSLSVVVIASPQQPAQSDPVVYISGGPGSPLTVFTGFQARHPYAADRDLILVDQRGTGRSEPRLCPDLQGELVNAMLAVVTDPTPAALAESRAAHAACHSAVVAHGIDPNAFGTSAAVEDYEWVRRALGVQRWNVVGESYGTTVAMTLLARHPEGVRSAVLDSLNPPDAFFGVPWSERVARARWAFFSACASKPVCASAHPGLADTYMETLARLRQTDPLVPVPSALHVPGDQVRLTPSLFEEVVGRLVYYPPTYPTLLNLIIATRDGDMRPFGTALANLLAEARRDGNEGDYVAVECRDRPRWRNADRQGESPLDLALLPPGICADWSALGPEPEVPNATAVPTLILQGEFDPNTGPEQSRRVSDLMGQKAKWVMMPGIGHNVRRFSSCAQNLVASFIAKPDQEAGLSCIKQP